MVNKSTYVNTLTFLFAAVLTILFAFAIPSVSNVVLNSTTGLAYNTSDNLTVHYTLDEGDINRTMIDWRVNGSSIAILNLNFEPINELGNANPGMTSDTTPSPYFSNTTSYYDGGFISWHAFGENVSAGRWASSNVNGNVPEWIELDTGSDNLSYIVRGFSVKPYPGEAFNRWQLNASNDRETWTVLAEGIAPSEDYYITYNFSNSNYYRYYRFHMITYYHAELVSLSAFKLLKENGTYDFHYPKSISTNNFMVGTRYIVGLPADHPSMWQPTGGSDGDGAYRFEGGRYMHITWQNNTANANPSLLDFTNQNFTLLTRIYPNTNNAGQVWESRYEISGSDSGWMFGLGPTGTLLFDMGAVGVNDNAITSSAANAYVAGAWQWLGVVKTGKNITYYAGGLTKGSFMVADETIIYEAPAQYHSIGQVMGGFSGSYGVPAIYLNASMSNLLIFNRSLSHEEILMINNTNSFDVLSSQETNDNENWTVLVKPANATQSGTSVVASFSVTNPSGIDTAAPIISSITNISISNSSAAINWTTDESANGTVNYGTTESLGSASSNASYVAQHSINVTGLLNATLYYYNITSCDASGNCNTSGTYNFTTAQNFPAPPAIVFDRQFPNDLTTTNLFGIRMNLTYNITSQAGLNISRIIFFYKTNSSSSECLFFVNGTQQCGYLNITMSSNNSDTYFFHLDDNNIYPATYNYAEETMENTAHDGVVLINGNRVLRSRFLNISVLKQYSFFEFYAINTSGSPSPLRIYYCNSSYASGTVAGSNFCTLFSNFDYTNPYNHTHSENSKHYAVPLGINSTASTIGTVGITDLSYFALRGPINGDWNATYITSVSGASQTSINGGSAWTDLAGTADMHVHQFDGTELLNYYVCAYDVNNNVTCSDTKFDLLDLAGLPPGVSEVYSPNESIYTGTEININYTAAISPNGYAIQYYNLSLLNETSAFVSTIATNNGLNLSYAWNISEITAGNYIVAVTAIDSQNQTSTGVSENFTISHPAPIISSVANTSILSSSATISWTTDLTANSTVNYGTDLTLGSATSNATLVASHSMPLTGLTNGTLYYYNVTSCSFYGNCTVNGTFNFTTAEIPDTTAPIISDVSNISMSNESVTINWTTDESANGEIAAGINFTLDLLFSNASFTTVHSINVTGLLNATFYYYNITSCDSSGNCNVSDTLNFTTLASANDTSAPVISSVTNTSVLNESSTISWNTDDAANGTVSYGLTAALGTQTINSSFLTSRNISITGLTNATLYYYNVTSCNIYDNCTVNGTFNFTTAQNMVTPPNITEHLPERTVQWVSHNSTLLFNISNCTSDFDSSLNYSWTLDGVTVSTSNSYLFDASAANIQAYAIAGYCTGSQLASNITYYVQVINETDFTLMQIPDTQAETQGGTLVLVANRTKWINDTKNELHTLFVTHMGDVVATASHAEMWIVANLSQAVLDPDIPYSISPGNHDYDDTTTRTVTSFNTWFPISKFGAAAGTFESYGYNNSYHLFNSSGIQFMLFQLEMCPTNATLTWVNDTINANPDKWIIISEHMYTNSDGSVMTAASAYSCVQYAMPDANEPNMQWNKTYQHHKKLFMILSGHQVGSGGSKSSVAHGLNGNEVLQVLFNYQDVGGGYTRLWRFSPSQHQIYAQTYNTYTDVLLNTTLTNFNFTFDFYQAAPNVTILSPAPVDNVINDYSPQLNISAGGRAEVWASFDGAPSTLLCPFCSIFNNFFLKLSEGFHSLSLFANDTIYGFGLGSTNYINFTVALNQNYYNDFSRTGAISDINNLQIAPGRLDYKRLLLNETFSDGSYSDDSPVTWIAVNIAPTNPGNWTINTTGNFVQEIVGGFDALGNRSNVAKYTYLYAGAQQWRDFNFSFKMQAIDNDAIGVMFRYQDDNNYYRFKWVAEGTIRQIEKFVNGTYTLLTSDVSGYALNTWYDLSIAAKGSELAVYINGAKVLNATDSYLDRGSVALYEWGTSGVYFTNMTVINYNDTENTVFRNITTTHNITKITAVWNANNTNASNNISVDISMDDGATWTAAVNNTLVSGFNGNNLLYRVNFHTEDIYRTISLLDLNLSWVEGTEPDWVRYYNNVTTNLSRLSNYYNVTNISIAVSNKGKIWLQGDYDVNSYNISSGVNISDNFISLNSSALPNFNSTATLYLYNLSFTNPKIQKDGADCPSSICTRVGYSGGTLEFNVTQFSNYSAAENATDVSAPIISSVTNTSISNQSATINWTTDDSSNGTVRYGITSTLGSSVFNASQIIAHSINLTALLNSTLYYYNITSCNEFGNCTTNGTFNFTTAQSPAAANDTSAPIISSVTNNSISNESSTVSWNTDDAANGTISYGTTLSLGTNITNSSFLTSRDINLTGLLNSTLYYYNVTSCNIYGNCTTNGTFNFTTAQNADIAPPAVTSVTNTSISNYSVAINWTTNEPANSTVRYGLNLSLVSSVSNTSLVLAHSINLTSLLNATLYYYNITSCDASGNCNVSGTYNFTTAQSPATANDTSTPIISLVTNTSVTNSSVIIGWDTDDAANGTVSYGLTAALGTQTTNSSFLTSRNISITGLANATLYYYNVTSCNIYGNCTTNGTFNFTTALPTSVDWSAFMNNETTNFSQINPFNASNITITQLNKGKIQLPDTYDINGYNLSRDINISDNYISLNSSALPNLNAHATLYLYNLSFTNPRILRDGAVCSASICTEIDYSGGTLEFNVTQFSAYSADETPVSAASTTGGGGGHACIPNIELSVPQFVSLNKQSFAVLPVTVSNIGGCNVYGISVTSVFAGKNYSAANIDSLLAGQTKLASVAINLLIKPDIYLLDVAVRTTGYYRNEQFAVEFVSSNISATQASLSEITTSIAELPVAQKPAEQIEPAASESAEHVKKEPIFNDLFVQNLIKILKILAVIAGLILIVAIARKTILPPLKDIIEFK